MVSENAVNSPHPAARKSRAYGFRLITQISCPILDLYIYNLAINMVYLFISLSRLVQSAKILLLPPKYEKITVPSNHSFYQYCDSKIGLSSIAPCKVITITTIAIAIVVALSRS